MFAYVAAYLYEQDAPLAERKAQALTLDRALLGELLGQTELRELIEADVLAELESDLQYLREDRLARDADDVHDLLRRLGDLSDEEIALRSERDPGPWLEDLRGQRRAVKVRIAGQSRWIAAEDAGLFRDVLGVATPAGLQDTFLQQFQTNEIQFAPVDQRRARRTPGRGRGPAYWRTSSQRTTAMAPNTMFGSHAAIAGLTM